MYVKYLLAFDDYFLLLLTYNMKILEKSDIENFQL